MYRILMNGKTLYNPLLLDQGYSITEGKLNLELNKAGSLNVTITQNHPLYSEVVKMTSIFTVYEDESVIFKGRVLDLSVDFLNRKKIYCEGDLAYLLDSVVEPCGTWSGTVRQFLEKLIAEHNSKVEASKSFQVGTVTAGSSDHLELDIDDYSNTMDLINSVLVSEYEGYVMTRHEGSVTYLDYISTSTDKATQKIEFGINLLDLTKEDKSEDIFTCLIPTGAPIQNDEGEVIGHVTIESVNGGKNYIQDDEALTLYGRIWRHEEWSDITDPGELLSVSTIYMALALAQIESELTVDAVDLHKLNPSIQRFKLGNWIQVKSKPHDIEKDFLLKEMDLNLLTSAKDSFKFGAAGETLSGHQAAVQLELEKRFTHEQTAREKGIEILSDKMASMAGLYSSEEVINGAKIYYFHDRPTRAQSTMVIKINAEGIGVSQDHGEHWIAGATFDGDAVVRKLYAEGIEGEYVKAGTIRTEALSIGDFLNYATISEKKPESIPTYYNYKVIKDSHFGDWYEHNDINSESTKRIFMTEYNTPNYFDNNTVLRIQGGVWTEKAQNVVIGIWFGDASGAYITGSWQTVPIKAQTYPFNPFDVIIRMPTGGIPYNAKVYRIGVEFEQYGPGCRNCLQNCQITKISGRLNVGAGFIDSNGKFQIGPMKSVMPGDTDVEFTKAIWIDYGIEIMGGNDGNTPYIDFHKEANTTDDAHWDFSARIQNTEDNLIQFYGKRYGAGSTPESCTVQAGNFTGLIGTGSDRELKTDIHELSEQRSIEIIKNLNPVSFRYKEGFDDKIHHGLIAQELESVVPDSEWGIVNSSLRYKSVYYIDLIADLIKVNQYLINEVDSLKKDLHK